VNTCISLRYNRADRAHYRPPSPTPHYHTSTSGPFGGSTRKTFCILTPQPVSADALACTSPHAAIPLLIHATTPAHQRTPRQPFPCASDVFPSTTWRPRWRVACNCRWALSLLRTPRISLAGHRWRTNARLPDARRAASNNAFFSRGERWRQHGHSKRCLSSIDLRASVKTALNNNCSAPACPPRLHYCYHGR